MKYVQKGRVTVVIPCFNHGNQIREAVDSILAQTFEDFEIIVVDDKSDSKTQKVLREFTHPKMRVIFRSENGGPSVARNCGIAMASGEYILPLDADDAVRPTFLEKAVHVMACNPKVGVVSAGVQFRGERHSVWTPRSGGLNRILVDSIPPTSLFRSVCWQQVGGYDEKIKGVEDWDLWISIAKCGWVIEVIDEILIDFTYSDSGVHHQHVVSDDRVMTSVFEKHKDSFSEHIVEILLEHNSKRFETVELERRMYAAVRHLEEVHKNTKRSVSYRLGMVLTWPVRQIQRILSGKGQDEKLASSACT